MAATGLSVHSISSRSLPNHCTPVEFDVTTLKFTFSRLAAAPFAPQRDATEPARTD